MIRTQTKMTNQ
jgi:hypothetical protein